MADLEADGGSLSVEVVSGGSEVVIRVAGEMDISTVDELRESIAQSLTTRPKLLIFDLAEVSFMDSSGITVLLEATKAGTPVFVRTPSAAVRLIIEATGLADVIPIEP